MTLTEEQIRQIAEKHYHYHIDPISQRKNIESAIREALELAEKENAKLKSQLETMKAKMIEQSQAGEGFCLWCHGDGIHESTCIVLRADAIAKEEGI